MDSRLSPEQFAAIRAALARGAKIEAIKLYREATGLGLAESKDAVEHLAETGGLAAETSASVPGSRVPELPSSHDLSPGERASVIEALRRGQKLEAIKRFRNATGMGLAESKEAVEAMEADTRSTGSLHGSAPAAANAGSSLAPDGRTPLPNWDPNEEKTRSGCLGSMLLLALLLRGTWHLIATFS